MRVLVYSTGIVQNEPICGYANVVHTSSSFRPHTHTDTDTDTHTHTLSTFSYHSDEDCEPTGLKADIAQQLCNNHTTLYVPHFCVYSKTRCVKRHSVTHDTPASEQSHHSRFLRYFRYILMYPTFAVLPL